MAQSGLCCGLYRGTFYLKDLSIPNAPLLSVGNAEATITQEMTEIEQANYQSLGGSACKVAYPESVNLDLTLHCTSPENLAIAFLGTATQLAGATVTNESHPVNDAGELIPFNFVPNIAQPIVVTNVAGTTTYVKDEDYAITNAGIIILEGGDIPVDGTAIHIDYVYGQNWVVDMQTVSQKEYLVVLDGVNVGDSGNRPVVIKAWKVKFNPTESFALITDEFASLEVSGEILRDDTKSIGSKFAKFEWGLPTSSVY